MAEIRPWRTCPYIGILFVGTALVAVRKNETRTMAAEAHAKETEPASKKESGSCKYTNHLHPQKTCPYPPLEGDKDNFCLFHSRNDDKDKKAFWKGIQDKLKDKDFDFEGYYFPPGLEANFRGVKFTDANFRLAIFRGDADFSEAEFSGKGSANFSGARFSGEGGAYFIDAEFSGKGGANFSRARFSGAGGADFTGAEFSGAGGANFSVARFSGEGGANFSWAQFSGEGGADFTGAEFSGKGGANFSRARFSGAGGADFTGAEFSGAGGANFSVARFSGASGADFSGAEFSGEGGANFSVARFSGEGGAYFTGAQFSGEGGAYFIGTQFSGEDGTNFSGTDFSMCNLTLFEDTRFNKKCKCLFRATRFPWMADKFVFFSGTTMPIDLSQCYFLYSNTERLVFRNFKFLENEPEELPPPLGWLLKWLLKPVRKIILPDEKEDEPEEFPPPFRWLFKLPWLKPVRKIILPDEKLVGKEVELSKEKTGRGQGEEGQGEGEGQVTQEQVTVEYSHVEALYRQFKKNLEAEKDWEDAGEFHYGEMECKRKGLTANPGWLTSVRQNLGLLAWYRYFSGYGERPLRAFCWLVFFILLFAGAYWYLDAAPRQSFCDYYLWNLSIKAAFLQRIGESGSEPAGFLGKFFYLAESLICPTLIALFILALRRRVRR